MEATILNLALAATTLTKVVVDIVRGVQNVRSDLVPILALFVGPLMAILLMVAMGGLFTGPEIARAVAAGILAAGGAVGVTELQKRVQ